MLKNRTPIQFLISVIVVWTITFSNFGLYMVQAQVGDGLKRHLNAQSGRVSFIGPETGRVVPAAKVLGTLLRPQDPGMALMKRFAPEFGIKNPEHDLVEIKKNKSTDGHVIVHYQQKHQGLSVIGGELIVNTNENGDLYSINGEASPNLSLPTQPKVDSAHTVQTALQALAMLYQKTPADFVASAPELWIYDESLLRPSTQPAELVWRMEIIAKDPSLPIRELVLVNAQRGSISLHFNQIDTAWAWKTYTSPARATDTISAHRSTQATKTGNLSAALLPAPLVSTYTANHTSALPGSFICNQADPECSSGDSDAKAAHQYAIGTANLYAAQFNRNSIDNNGMTIVSTVHFCDLEDPFFGCPYANAFWSGTQMVYGDAYGFALADDVVGHELTHGVTQHESNLFYYYQSGAINESLSDVFGEYYDQTNGQGSDGASVKWLIGEDISDLGAIRSMSDPPAFENPDKMSSPYYYKDEADNGGVHYNSGINNKAVFLMVNGGTFNGKTVTAISWDKVAAIFYEVNANLLTSGADYSDLYYALQQACTNLIGQKGITAGDCATVKNAADAVEMNGQPEPNFNTDAPLCADGSSVTTFFYDGFENGTSNWTFNNGAYPRWQIDSPDGAYARSGLHSLFANGQPAGATDTTARLVPIVIPPNGYLHFAQAYGFSSLGPGYYFDGGVLEYSTNNGSSWVDTGSLIDYNGYKGTIFPDFGNPLAGRSGFVGASHGYISTRLNLSSLAGQSVTFRWRMGLGDFDFFGYSFGWWLDDIRVFNCSTSYTISGNAGAAGVTLNYSDGTPKAVLTDSSGNYSIAVPAGWAGTVTPVKVCYAFNPPSRSYSNVTSNQINQNYTYTILPSCSPGIGKYDDTHSNWVYHGSWTHFTGAFPFYNNTDSYSGVTGDTASFIFSGTQFILTYTMNTVRGNMEIYVDGNKIATINAYGPQTFQVLYISPMLSSGVHVAQVRNAGGGYIDVDAIQILNTAPPGAGKYDDTHANWIYTGSWTHFTGSFPFYNNTDSYSAVNGDTASFPFTGRQFILTYTRNTVRGNMEIFVDGNKIATMNANGSQTFEVLYISPVLSSGAHVMQVRNAGGGGGYVDVDAIQILNTTPPGVGKYDDTHSNWAYTGSWTHFTGAYPFYNNTDSYSGITGDTTSFTFTGSQFILTYTMNTVRGNMEIFVDGNKIATINAYGPQTFQVLYTSAVFPNGTHVVKIRNAGGGGGYIDVDAIQILNTPAPGAGKYDDTHSNWVYVGSWTHFTGSFPFYNNTDSYSGVTGDAAAFTFSGTQFILTYTMNPVRGTMEVYVDGNKIATLNAFGTQTFQVLYTSPTFSNGTHQVQVRNAGGGLGYIDVDAIQIN